MQHCVPVHWQDWIRGSHWQADPVHWQAGPWQAHSGPVHWQEAPMQHSVPVHSQPVTLHAQSLPTQEHLSPVHSPGQSLNVAHSFVPGVFTTSQVMSCTLQTVCAGPPHTGIPVPHSGVPDPCATLQLSSDAQMLCPQSLSLIHCSASPAGLGTH